MGMEALARAAEAAGYAMASIDDIDDVAPTTPAGDAVARGARTPKPVAKSTALVPAVAGSEKTMAANIYDQSVAAGTALRQAVYGYIGGRGAPA